jgi:cell wall-associated NlpC family hydrolase
MKSVIYIVCLLLLSCFTSVSQTLSKDQAKLEKLLVKSPDRCIRKSNRLIEKGKGMALPYYYLTCSNYKKYTQLGKTSYLTNSLRSYGKYQKYNKNSNVVVNQKIINDLSTAYEVRITEILEKKKYSKARKEADKFSKLFGSNVNNYDQIVATNDVKQKKAKKKNSSTPKKNVSNTISVSESKLITDAQSVLGTRYIYGGETSSGLDCSGFTKYVYQKSGVNIPHSAKSQSKLGTLVSKEDCKTGDLIFFGSKSNNGYHFQHVGMIYANENGEIKIIHCPNSGVCIEGEGEPSYDMYWNKRFLFIKRLNNNNLLTTKNK